MAVLCLCLCATLALNCSRSLRERPDGLFEEDAEVLGSALEQGVAAQLPKEITVRVVEVSSSWCKPENVLGPCMKGTYLGPRAFGLARDGRPLWQPRVDVREGSEEQLLKSFRTRNAVPRRLPSLLAGSVKWIFIAPIGRDPSSEEFVATLSLPGYADDDRALIYVTYGRHSETRDLLLMIKTKSGWRLESRRLVGIRG